jgi:hypothetical protein
MMIETHFLNSTYFALYGTKPYSVTKIIKVHEAELVPNLCTVKFEFKNLIMRFDVPKVASWKTCEAACRQLSLLFWMENKSVHDVNTDAISCKDNVTPKCVHW